MTRRGLLGAGLGLASLPAWIRAASPATREARSLILVWLDGGLSHLDSFDYKPDAPLGIRGELGARPTAVDGLVFSEALPRLAERADRCVVLRSLTSGEGQHARASSFMLTGHRPSAVVEHPSIAAFHATAAEGALPDFVAVPDAHPAAKEGFLSRVHAPFELCSDPARPDFEVRDLQPASSAERARRWRERLDELDGGPRSEAEAARDSAMRRAAALSGREDARAVFSLAAESEQTRQRYGLRGLGPSLLLARRLVAAGVSSVFVRSRGWDHHVAIADALTRGFPPPLPDLDQAVSALIDDLTRTRLDRRVCLVVASEFGRTPRLNPRGGRDHWPRAGSALLFGAGLRRGAVVGATDARGMEPREDPISPADFCATLATALGHDPSQRLSSPDGRPIPLVQDGGRAVRAALEEGR